MMKIIKFENIINLFKKKHKKNILCTDSRYDLILLLLKQEKIVGYTRIIKLLFLMQEEGKFKKLIKYPRESFNFKPSNLGPYTHEVFDLLNTLESLKLIKIDVTDKIPEDMLEITQIKKDILNKEMDCTISLANNSFLLTSEGQKLADILYDGLDKKYKKYLTREIYSWYSHLGLFDLLSFIYKKYPKYSKYD